MINESAIAERCIDCLRSVAWGSGLYVNRIPADGVWTIVSQLDVQMEVPVDGWLCADCQYEGDEE